MNIEKFKESIIFDILENTSDEELLDYLTDTRDEVVAIAMENLRLRSDDDLVDCFEDVVGDPIDTFYPIDE